jgi:hypothetical protein
MTMLCRPADVLGEHIGFEIECIDRASAATRACRPQDA